MKTGDLGGCFAESPCWLPVATLNGMTRSRWGARGSFPLVADISPGGAEGRNLDSENEAERGSRGCCLLACSSWPAWLFCYTTWSHRPVGWAFSHESWAKKRPHRPIMWNVYQLSHLITDDPSLGPSDKNLASIIR